MQDHYKTSSFSQLHKIHSRPKEKHSIRYERFVLLSFIIIHSDFSVFCLFCEVLFLIFRIFLPLFFTIHIFLVFLTSFLSFNEFMISVMTLKFLFHDAWNSGIHIKWFISVKKLSIKNIKSSQSLAILFHLSFRQWSKQIYSLGQILPLNVMFVILLCHFIGQTKNGWWYYDESSQIPTRRIPSFKHAKNASKGIKFWCFSRNLL